MQHRLLDPSCLLNDSASVCNAVDLQFIFFSHLNRTPKKCKRRFWGGKLVACDVSLNFNCQNKCNSKANKSVSVRHTVHSAWLIQVAFKSIRYSSVHRIPLPPWWAFPFLEKLILRGWSGVRSKFIMDGKVQSKNGWKASFAQRRSCMKSCRKNKRGFL